MRERRAGGSAVNLRRHRAPLRKSGPVQVRPRARGRLLLALADRRARESRQSCCLPRCRPLAPGAAPLRCSVGGSSLEQVTDHGCPQVRGSFAGAQPAAAALNLPAVRCNWRNGRGQAGPGAETDGAGACCRGCTEATPAQDQARRGRCRWRSCGLSCVSKRSEGEEGGECAGGCPEQAHANRKRSKRGKGRANGSRGLARLERGQGGKGGKGGQEGGSGWKQQQGRGQGKEPKHGKAGGEYCCATKQRRCA